jgi:hypothetical protein
LNKQHPESIVEGQTIGAHNVDRRDKENVCVLKSSLVVSKYPRCFLVDDLQPDWDTIRAWRILTLSHGCFWSDIVLRRSRFVLGEKTAAGGCIDRAFREFSFIETRTRCNIGQLHRAFLNNPPGYFLRG